MSAYKLPPMEPVARIELAYPAWKAGVLPLNHTGMMPRSFPGIATEEMSRSQGVVSRPRFLMVIYYHATFVANNVKPYRKLSFASLFLGNTHQRPSMQAICRKEVTLVIVTE